MAPNVSSVIGPGLEKLGATLGRVGIGNVINMVVTSGNILGALGTIGVSIFTGSAKGVISRIKKLLIIVIPINIM